MNLKVKLSIFAFLILIVICGYLISIKIEPPPATIEIDGNKQISSIGGYCWRGILNAICADVIGIPTPQEPLITGSPFTAFLRLPLQEPPYELKLNLIPVTELDELNFSARGWRWWRSREGIRFDLRLESESEIELSPEPGTYVLNIEAWWMEKGSASYGFLVEVRDEIKLKH